MAFNKLRRDVQAGIEGLMLQPEVDVDKAFLRRLFERVLAALGGPVADMHQFRADVEDISRADAKVKTMAEVYSGSGPEDISAENRLQMGTWAEMAADGRPPLALLPSVEEEAGPDAMLSPATCSSFEGIGVPHSTAPHPPTDAEWTDIGRAPLPVGRIDI